MYSDVFPEHYCNEDCMRFCESCSARICTYGSDSGFVITAGLIFCKGCKHEEKWI